MEKRQQITTNSEKEPIRSNRIAIFPGSFDPFTIGHESLVKRGLKLFDQIIIAIGSNKNKKCLFSEQERLKQISDIYSQEPKVKVIIYSTLTTDLASKMGAEFILRGVRSNIDFEFEKDLAIINHDLGGIETIMLMPEPNLEHVSSSMVRELLLFGKDVTKWIPKGMKINKQ